eukprot:g7807.t1
MKMNRPKLNVAARDEKAKEIYAKHLASANYSFVLTHHGLVSEREFTLPPKNDSNPDQVVDNIVEEQPLEPVQGEPIDPLPISDKKEPLEADQPASVLPLPSSSEEQPVKVEEAAPAKVEEAAPPVEQKSSALPSSEDKPMEEVEVAASQTEGAEAPVLPSSDEQGMETVEEKPIEAEPLPNSEEKELVEKVQEAAPPVELDSPALPSSEHKQMEEAEMAASQTEGAAASALPSSSEEQTVKVEEAAPAKVEEAAPPVEQKLSALASSEASQTEGASAPVLFSSDERAMETAEEKPIEAEPLHNSEEKELVEKEQEAAQPVELDSPALPSSRTTGLGMGAPPTFGVEPQRGHVAHTAPNLGAGAPVTGPLNAANLWHQLDATAAPPSAPSISSAFEMLGKPVHRPAATTVDPQETMMKALTAALSGDRKNLPSWSGDIATLRPWLRQLMLWEVDNNVPKHKWGLKLMQAFGEQSPPRRIAETIDLAILTSESGYSAILSAIMVKYGPYLEAAGPASIETFFYGTERNRNENLSTYIAAKEVALQELESHLGEKLPSRIAGRILLKHANLSDAQKEAMAVRYNALLSFGQAAAALRPLDRPDALVQKVTKTYLTAQDYGGDEDEEEEELLPADAEEPEDEEGPESDGQGNMTFLMFDPQEEYTEEEATYIWAYNSACKDVRRELQARRKGRQFFKKGNTPPVQKKGKNKGFQRRGFGKGRNSAGGAGRGRGQARGAPDELLARTKCFSCGGLGHMSRDCPHQETPQTFFAHSGSSSQSRIYAVNVKAEVQRQLDVFAGARTDDCEGVVDTAAEEAIIGSSAMSRLRAALAKFGLQPIPAEGTTATCAGIGTRSLGVSTTTTESIVNSGTLEHVRKSIELVKKKQTTVVEKTYDDWGQVVERTIQTEEPNARRFVFEVNFPETETENIAYSLDMTKSRVEKVMRGQPDDHELHGLAAVPEDDEPHVIEVGDESIDFADFVAPGSRLARLAGSMEVRYAAGEKGAGKWPGSGYNKDGAVPVQVGLRARTPGIRADAPLRS